MKRLNPNTNKPFKRGDVRDDGHIFGQYQSCTVKKDGYYMEQWLSPEAFNASRLSKKQYSKTERSSKKGHIRQLFSNIKNRAKTQNISFDLDLDYLVEIAPDNCPVFGFTLSWGSSNKTINQNSPSLDKIIPELGYTKGNVQWLSSLANAMKQNATPEQLKQFANWVMS
jgi:hypothetical protein